MKKLIAFLLSLFVFSTANAYVNRPNAVISVLDKASGKTHTVTVPVESNAKYEKLDFIIRSCKQTDPFQAENAYMFIEITTNGEKIFSGWMNKNAPGENPLQNADYDIWLVRCK